MKTPELEALPTPVLAYLSAGEREALDRLLFAIPFSMVHGQARHEAEARAMVEAVTKLRFALDRVQAIPEETGAVRLPTEEALRKAHLSIAQLQSEVLFLKAQLSAARLQLSAVPGSAAVHHLAAQIDYLKEGLDMCAQTAPSEAQRIAADVLDGHRLATTLVQPGPSRAN